MKVSDLLSAVEQIYPVEHSMPKDRIGLQVGSLSRRVTRVLVTLDPDLDAVTRAIKVKADAIVSHHPIWWDPPRTLLEHNATGRGAVLAAAKNIAIIAAHTNADFAPGGLCDDMTERLGLSNVESLKPYGRIGAFKPGSWSSMRALIRKSYGDFRRAGKLPRQVRRVAVCSGSGSDLLEAAAAAGADLFVTGDVKYHGARDAETLGITLVDAGHHSTEISFVARTAKKLSSLLAVRVERYVSEDPFHNE